MSPSWCLFVLLVFVVNIVAAVAAAFAVVVFPFIWLELWRHTMSDRGVSRNTIVECSCTFVDYTNVFVCKFSIRKNATQADLVVDRQQVEHHLHDERMLFEFVSIENRFHSIMYNTIDDMFDECFPQIDVSLSIESIQQSSSYETHCLLDVSQLCARTTVDECTLSYWLAYATVLSIAFVFQELERFPFSVCTKEKEKVNIENE
jgi:hypothetical protein